MRAERSSVEVYAWCHDTSCCPLTWHPAVQGSTGRPIPCGAIDS